MVALTYYLPDNAHSLRVTGCHDNVFESPISTDDIKQACGEPIRCHGNDIDELMLVYKESCFTFAVKNNVFCLTKIKISLASSFTPFTPQVNFIVSNSTRHPVNGLSISTNGLCTATKTFVHFGDHHQDILSKLGAANEVFYPARSDSAVLSYKHLGLALVMDTLSHTLTKIVLYANNPPHRDFCVYSRCPFELSISKTSVCTDYTSCDNLLVTAVTNWSVVAKYVESDQIRNIGALEHGSSTNNVCPFPNTTLYTLFNDVIFEITSTGNIATVTLLSHDSHMTHMYPQQRPSQTLFTEFNVDSLFIENDHNSDIESEDSFQSAQSSIRSDGSLEAPKDEKKTHRALLGTNLNIVIEQQAATECSMADDRLVYYHFTPHSPHSSDTVLYTSDTLQIFSSPSEPTPTLGEDDEFEIVSFDDLQEHTVATRTEADESSTLASVLTVNKQAIIKIVFS